MLYVHLIHLKSWVPCFNGVHVSANSCSSGALDAQRSPASRIPAPFTPTGYARIVAVLTSYYLADTNWKARWARHKVASKMSGCVTYSLLPETHRKIYRVHTYFVQPLPLRRRDLSCHHEYWLQYTLRRVFVITSAAVNSRLSSSESV